MLSSLLPMRRRIGLFFAMGLLAANVASADPADIAVLQGFESGTGGALAVDPGNSTAAGLSNSVAVQATDDGGNRLKITDPDGGTNGVMLEIPNGIPAPGYYLFTAEVKVSNPPGEVGSYGMGVRDHNTSGAKISDVNAGYVMNLGSGANAALGYQKIGAAINVEAGGSFPRSAVVYFSTDVSGNNVNSPSDGNFTNSHRGNLPAWSAGSSAAVYVDNITRTGPGRFGEERHLWISVGDGFTNLASLENLLVKAKENNFNCVDILGRYRADAYYVPNRTDASFPNPEPFGTRVSGGNASPSNDPLQYAIDRGHELGLKVYVSFSSFLVTPNATYPESLPTGSVMGFYNGTGTPRDMTTADGGEGLWADLGRADVRAYTKNILMDIVKNYDIDGVVFDRVRYPGRNFGYNPVALGEMGFGAATPAPANGAWMEARRNAATTFLGECYEAVTTEKPWVVVSATPVAFSDHLGDTYNHVFQHWPKWVSRKTANRTVDFGCIDLFQPQFYRTSTTADPFKAPGSNKRLMEKAVFGDTAAYGLDFGLTPGAYSHAAPLLYHPLSNNTPDSNANAQNILDARSLHSSGFGLFAGTTTINDILRIRSTASNTAGVDVLAAASPTNDYLFKTGYETLPPNAVTNFTATPQARGSVVFNWDVPAPAADGDQPASYLIYRSATQPVREVWANQVTKLAVEGNWFHAPVATEGTYYYKIVPVDDYNNRGASTVIGPVTVAGSPAVPADIIIDNPAATVTGAWTPGTNSASYGPGYLTGFKGTGARTATFTGNLPVAGNWDVYEWHVAGSNRSTDAPHTIQHAGGSTLVKVDQQLMANNGKWNKIGTYAFNAGNASVTITDAFLVGSVVMADAIRFAYVATPTPVPAAPTGIAAQVVSATAINVSWADNATDETGYELERTIEGGTTVLIPLPANSTSYSDTALASDTEYTYVVRAFNTGAQSADSDVVAARTLPEIPADIIIDNTEASFLPSASTTHWAVGTFNPKWGVDYRSVSKASSVGARSATFPFVPARTAVYDVYEWHVAGATRAGDAPHIVNHAGGQTVVSVNQVPNGGKWNKIGTFQFTGGTTHSVVLSNAFTVGTTMMADAIRIAYVSEPPTTPAVPSGLTATAVSESEITLVWTDNAVNETGYTIERTKAGGTAQIVASVGADVVTYTDSGLDGDTLYSYVVRSVNAIGPSAPSNQASAQTFSATPPDVIIDNTQAVLTGTWSLNATAADRYGANYAFRGKTPNGANKATFAFTARDTGMYEIYEWHSAGTNRPTDARHIINHRSGPTVLTVDQTVAGGQWNKIGTWAFNGGTQYSVVIDDLFINGVVVIADAVKVVWAGELPPAPDAAETLTVTAASTSQANLSWVDASDNETGFIVRRNGAIVTTVAANATAYHDTGLAECTHYTYTVTAVNEGGEAAPSNTASIYLISNVPQVTAPADVTVAADAGACGASNVTIGSATAPTDTCSSFTISSDAPATFAVGTTVVTWTATDVFGNTSTDTQSVTVNDEQDPTITAPADLTVSTNPGSNVTTGVVLGDAVTADNCGVDSVTNDAPGIYPMGTTVVTWTVTDVHGNTATTTQNITVVDTEAPQLTAPAAVSVTASVASCSFTGSIGSASASDNSGSVSVSNDALASFGVGVTVVTWVATDPSGNVTSATQSISVANNAPVATTVSAEAVSWSENSISWDAVSNAVSYDVLVASSATGPFTVLATVTNQSGQVEFTHSGLIPNTKYFYAVETVNGCGRTGSNVVEVKTSLFEGVFDTVSASSTWLTVNDPSAVNGTFLEHDRRTTANPATWNYTVPVAGTYKLMVFIPTIGKFTTQARYDVPYAGGQLTGVVDQKHHTGTWVHLTTVNLNAGTNLVRVYQVSNSTNAVAADALKVIQEVPEDGCHN